MCFAPQQRALFRHPNFQKCTEPVSFYTFDFEMCFAPQRRAPFRHRKVRALISWEGLHFGASDLQFWEDDFAWQVQHFVWPGINFSWQAQYFRQVEWKNRKTHWYAAVSAALNFPFLKEVSQNCFDFDVVKCKNWGSLAELLRFLCCQLWKMKRSRRIASFLILSTLKMKTSRRIAWFSSLQIDR